jgi:hypothetical protein
MWWRTNGERGDVLVADVQMRAVRPDGPRYATFQLEDKVTFVAFAEMGCR